MKEKAEPRAFGPGRVIKNLAYLLTGETFSKVVTFAAIAYMARVVGPAGFGYVEFAAAVLLCASLVVDLGFGPYGAREIARSPERATELVREIVSARFVLALAAYAVIGGGALVLVTPPVLRQLLLIYGLGLLVSPLLLPWVLQGQHKMGAVAALQVLRQATYAVVIFAFLRRESDVRVAAIAEVAGLCVATGCGIWIYRGLLAGAARGGFALPASLFRETIPIGVSQMFWMLRMFGATVLVGMVATPQDVGFFGGAMRIYIAVHAFVWLHFFNLLPSLSQAWHRNDGSFAALLGQSLRLIAWAGVAGGTAWVLLAQLAAVAVYGGAFAPAAAPLRWLGVALVVAGLSGHYRYGLLASGHQSAEMMASALGTLVAVVLIPVGYGVSGISGAAVALLVAEVVVWGTAWAWARTKLGLTGHLRLLLPPAAAAALGLALFWALPFSTSIRTAALATSVTLLPVLLDGEARARLRAMARTRRPALHGEGGRQ